jgi:hypothetical protein
VDVDLDVDKRGPVMMLMMLRLRVESLELCWTLATSRTQAALSDAIGQGTLLCPTCSLVATL